MAADERVEAHKYRAAHPRLGHTRSGERVRQRKRWKWALEGRYGRQDASMVMLYERVPKADRVVRPRVRCSPSVAGQVLARTRCDNMTLQLSERRQTKGMTRTAPSKTRAYAIHAFVRLHLANKHVARFSHVLPDLRRLVQRNRSTVAGGTNNPCYGQRLAIQDYTLPTPTNEKRVSLTTV